MSLVAQGQLSDVSAWQESRTEWKADRDAFVADQKAVRKTGKLPEHLGPPPSGFALLPWLLMGMGAFSNLFQGKTPNPWIGGIGLLVFNSLYIHVAFRAFTKETREARSTRVRAGRAGHS